MGIELAGRIPINLSPGQVLLVAAVAGALLVALLASNLLEAALGGFVSLVLRLTGHPPPRKSSFRMALDEMQERLDRKQDRD